MRPTDAWPAGEIEARIKHGETVIATATFGHNLLGGSVEPAEPPRGTVWEAGDDIPITGTVFQLDESATGVSRNGVPASFVLQVVRPNGKKKTIKNGAETRFTLTVEDGDAFLDPFFHELEVEDAPVRPHGLGLRTPPAFSVILIPWPHASSSTRPGVPRS